MTIQGISTNVQALLAANPLLVSVLPHPPTESVNFDGYPSACHYYEGTDSTPATVSQHRRIINYTVEVIYVPGASRTEAEKFQDLYAFLDNIIQMFDESIDLSSQTIPLARACDIMRPVPGKLEEVTTENGKGYLMTITLMCEADTTFR